jgi:hypothetical protein
MDETIVAFRLASPQFGLPDSKSSEGPGEGLRVQLTYTVLAPQPPILGVTMQVELAQELPEYLM